MAEQPFDLARFPVHLGLGATVEHLPEHDGSPAWYERYRTEHRADGDDGRLVSLHTFDAPWDTWEVHPHGEELVACTSGRITLHQQVDGDVRSAVLEVGQAIVNPAGVWHTADVDDTATALFITAGLGTHVRPRA
jgi:mannose-6-phosphate isomerase-like protein (cupin superfamily)